MEIPQSSSSSGFSRSYTHSESFGGREVNYRRSKISEGDNNNQREYNTFNDFSNDSEEIRKRSVSLPYVTCGPRALKRTLSSMQSNSVDEETAGLNGVSVVRSSSQETNSSDRSSPTEVGSQIVYLKEASTPTSFLSRLFLNVGTSDQNVFLAHRHELRRPNVESIVDCATVLY